MIATCLGSKGTRARQQFLPNTFPNGALNPCPTCPTGFTFLFSSQITAGSGLPLTPIYFAAVRGTGVTGSIRPDYTGVPLYDALPGDGAEPERPEGGVSAGSHHARSIG